MVSRERWARVWPAASVAVWLLGVVARCVYVLRLHHPRHYIITDARQLVDLAQKLIDAPTNQVAYDTVWPPGTSAILAVLLARDPTGGVAAGVQLLLSCLLPLLVAHTAWMIGGKKLAAIALVFASLHPGFVHSAGFFLSEQFFQFAIGLAMWASLAVVAWERESDARDIACDLRPSAARSASPSGRPGASPPAFGPTRCRSRCWSGSGWLCTGGGRAAGRRCRCSRAGWRGWC